MMLLTENFMLFPIVVGVVVVVAAATAAVVRLFSLDLRLSLLLYASVCVCIIERGYDGMAHHLMALLILFYFSSFSYACLCVCVCVHILRLPVHFTRWPSILALYLSHSIDRIVSHTS